MSAPPSPENPWVPPRLRQPPPMDHAPGAKESAYTPEMGQLILDRLAAGETVKAITADPRMPCYATVYRWTRVIEDFGEAWRAVRMRLCADAIWADQERARARAWMRAHARRLAGKPARDWRSGTRSSYTPQMAEAVCAAVREGASLSDVVRTPGMPSFKAIYRWLKIFPAFRAQYVDACAYRDGWLDFQAVMIAEESTPLTFRADKRRVAALDGRAGRMRPKKYRALPPEDPARRLGSPPARG